jgi:2-C-methyl-D-erythritol 4-phosphate cytidylyltransferase
VAAGQGRRFGGELKQFAAFASQPLVVSSLRALNKVKQIKGLVLVAPPPQVKYAQTLITNYSLTKVKKVVPGGSLRQESVFNGLLTLPEEVDLVIVHDGVRPNITAAMVEKMLAVFPTEADGLIMAIPAFDSLKLVKENKIVKTIRREDVWLAQTRSMSAIVQLSGERISSAPWGLGTISWKLGW